MEHSLSPEILAWVGFAFAAGGLVKGVIGIGLPLVVVPVLAIFVGPVPAVSLMFVPAVASNIMQIRQAKLRPGSTRRFWPAIAGIIGGSVLGSTVLSGVDARVASASLGAVVVLFCLTQLLTRLPPISPAAERWFTPIAGTASGAAGGLTGFFGLALVPYLLALRLPKEDFVATIAMLYLYGVAALFGNLALTGVLTPQLVAVSSLATVPTLGGVWVGSRVRRYVPEALFRRVLVGLMLVIAANLIWRSVGT